MSMQTDDKDDGEYGSELDGDGKIPDVYRPQDSFPWGRECELTVDDLPDDEDEYYWTKHYKEDSRQRSSPVVTDEIIAEILSEGVVHKPRAEELDDRLLVQKQIDDYEWTIVVGDDRHRDDIGPDWALITVYSNGHGSVGTTNSYFSRLKERKNGGQDD
jgi:hypothetical protein